MVTTDIELLVEGHLDVGHAAVLHHGGHGVHTHRVRGSQSDLFHVGFQDSLKKNHVVQSLFGIQFHLNLLDRFVREVKFWAKSFKHLIWNILVLFSIIIVDGPFSSPVSTHHDAKSLLHNIDDGGLCFLPDLRSPSLINVRLHLHQRLQSNKIKICFKRKQICSPSICLGLSFEASAREVV